MLNVPVDRDTAVALIAQARQLSIANLEALDDRGLEDQLRSVDIRQVLRHCTEASTGEAPPHELLHNGKGLDDVQLTPPEARVVADELILAGDNLVRKALDQLDRGAVLDELMRAANGLLQRGNELLLSSTQAANA